MSRNGRHSFRSRISAKPSRSELAADVRSSRHRTRQNVNVATRRSRRQRASSVEESPRRSVFSRTVRSRNRSFSALSSFPIVITSGKAASTARYDFPVNHEIRPAVQLTDGAVASVYPPNEIFEKATGSNWGFIEIYSGVPATGGIGTSEIAGTAYVSRAIG